MSEGGSAGDGGGEAASGGSAPSVANSLGVESASEPDAGTPEANQEPAVENVPEWAQSFNPEDQAVVAQKGWKDFSDAVKAYKGVESRLGVNADRLATIPDFGDPNEAELADFNARMGIPVDADGYEALELDTANGAIDGNSLSRLSKAADLRPDQHAKIGAEIQTILNEAATQQAEDATARDAKQEHDLKGEWGQMFSENAAHAAKAPGVLGIDGEAIGKIQSVLGYGETMKMLARVGISLSEGGRGDDGEGSGSPAPFGLTPEGAKAQLEGLNADPEHADIMGNPSHPRYKSELARRRALQSTAFY